MRKISGLQILVFVLQFSIILGLAIASAILLFGNLRLGDFRGIFLVLSTLILTYLIAFAVFRIFLSLFPLREGNIPPRSQQEFVYHVYLLFFLVLFFPVMRSGSIPVPLMRLIYLALGAKLGDNTYSSGLILDPIFVEVGSNTLIGQFSLLVPHAIENEKLSHHRIRIGSGVTIGAHSVVMAGVTIEDNALVAMNSVVIKGTHIGAGEIWGGTPAKKLRGKETT